MSNQDQDEGVFGLAGLVLIMYNIKQVGIALTHTAIKLPSGCLLNSQKMTYQTRIPLWLTYGCAAGVDVPVSPSVARGQDLCIQESMDCSNSNLVR